MFKRSFAAFVIIAAGFALCTVINGRNFSSLAQGTPASQKVVWEYTWTNKARDLNKLGAEGWELVGISDSVALSKGDGSSTAYFYFKRAK